MSCVYLCLLLVSECHEMSVSFSSVKRKHSMKSAVAMISKVRAYILHSHIDLGDVYFHLNQGLMMKSLCAVCICKGKLVKIKS